MLFLKSHNAKTEEGEVYTGSLFLNSTSSILAVLKLDSSRYYSASVNVLREITSTSYISLGITGYSVKDKNLLKLKSLLSDRLFLRYTDMYILRT